MSKAFVSLKGYEQVPEVEGGSFNGNERVASHNQRTLTSTQCFILCLSSSSLMLGLGYFAGSWNQNIDDLCFKRHSTYSPATEHIDTSYHNVRFNGTLDMESVYKGEPSKELDDAWHKLENFQVTYLTEDELHEIPGNVDSIRMPPEAKLDNAYLGTFEVFHQLHCLNWMRKASFWNYPYYKTTDDFTDPPDMQRKHFDHCADMLRQNLMCNADVSIVTFKWVKGRHTPYPNFNNWHMCRNFDSIVDFAQSRAVGSDWEKDWLRPLEGETVWDVPP